MCFGGFFAGIFLVELETPEIFEMFEGFKIMWRVAEIETYAVLAHGAHAIRAGQLVEQGDYPLVGGMDDHSHRLGTFVKKLHKRMQHDGILRIFSLISHKRLSG
jgi:hypothetical protein